MSDLRELFQEVILDHYRKPRNFGELSSANRVSHGTNPLCGDDVMIYVEVDDENRINKVQFTGSGCAICTASASMMTDALEGHTVAEADALFEKFHAVTKGESDAVDGIGKLTVFGGVAQYPVRVKCATLPWHTVQAAIHGKDESVSTE